MTKFESAGSGVPIAIAALLCLASTPVHAANVTIVNGGCSSFATATDASGNLIVTCNTGTVPPPPPSSAPSCTSLTAAPNPVGVVGGLTTLTANGCTTGATLDWTASTTGTGLQPTTDATTRTQAGVSVPADTTFTARPLLAGVSGNPVAALVTVPTSTGGTPPTVLSCQGFRATKVIDATVPAGNVGNLLYFTSKFGGFGQQDALVIRFQAPPSDSNFVISAVTASGATTSFHSWVLASEPCIFDPAAAAAIGGAAQTKTMFSLSMSSDGSQMNNLIPGKTYFLNVSHRVYDQWACSGSTCDMLFTFTNQ